MDSTIRAREPELELEAAPRALAVPGLAYLPAFVDEQEESSLMLRVGKLELKEAPYKEYTARRRIASFGFSYDFSTYELKRAEPIPDFLLPVRRRAAGVLGVPEADLCHALVTEYRAGTPLGWHRDTPEFGVIFGLSLGETARLRFRPYPPARGARVLHLDLAPRSAYVIRDEARSAWQHSVAPTAGLRYSITLRTLRQERSA